MNFKKVLLGGLSVVLATSLLVGCGKTGKPEDLSGRTLKIAGLDGGYGTKGWEAVAKAFEEQTGAKVELQFEKNIADTLRPVLTSGKDVPDLIYLSLGAAGGLTDTMVKEKAVLDITDVLSMTIPGEKGTVKEKILGGFTEGLSVSPYGDGKLYLAPLNYGPCGLFYDANLLKSKGWEVPTTWDEMWALGDKAKAEGIALFTYPTTGYFDAFFSSLLNATAGPELYAKLMNYDTEAWKNEKVKQAFDIVGKLATYTEANTVANANKEGFTKNQQLILDNKAIFIPNGTWLPGEMAEAPRVAGFEWGFTSIPAVTKGGDRYASAWAEQMYIPTSAKNADLAKAFIAYSYSDKAVELFYKEGKGAVMPTAKVSDFVEGENVKFFSIYNNGAKTNSMGFAATDPIEGVDLTSAEGILYGTVNSVVNGSKTVDQWYNAVLEAVAKFDK
ncbi:MAG: carbohydrate ABC transporter substrate-binding protein [Erysipelotrichaceae bacterium]